MKFSIQIFILVLFATSVSFASDPPKVIWTKKYTIGHEEWAEKIIRTSDNNLIIAGRTDSPKIGSSSWRQDLLLMKINYEGDTLWTNAYGDFNLYEYGHDVIETDDRGFIIVGGGVFNTLLIVKTDSIGNKEWSISNNEIGNHFYAGKSIFEIDTNQYMVVATDYLIKINGQGDTLWTKDIHLKSERSELTNDGALIIAGSYSANAQSSNAGLIKIKFNGDYFWSRSWHTNVDYGLSVTETQNSNYLFSASTVSHGKEEPTIIMINSNGETVWEKVYSIPPQKSGYGHFYKLFELENSRFILAGNDYRHKGWIKKINETGITIWDYYYDKKSVFYDLISLEDGGYIVVGYYDDDDHNSDADVLIMRIAPETIAADYIADKTYGSAPLTVKFNDLTHNSLEEQITSWEWDFENDGVIDSYVQNPEYTYFKADSYSVKLIVSNGVSADTLIKENYIITFQDTFPKIYSIQDIPNDQGGWLKVQFARSVFDTDSLIFPKTNSTELYTVELDDGSGWTAAASTAAYGQSLYSVLIPTTKDSTSESDGFIYFRVIAGMEEGNYVSNIDSGYSVDNLKPAVPKGLLASLLTGSKVKLKWLPNTENDFKYYTIYKNNNSKFESIHQTIDTVFTDLTVQVEQSYSYAITATDHNGNESSLSEAVEIVVTSLNEESVIPSKYYLAQNYPNPFNPETTIMYGLKNGGYVEIVIYDVLGNKIKDLVSGYKTAGHHQITWVGENDLNEKVSSGVFFYQIITNDFKQHKKMLLLK
ncbi:MAG: T9SS C-terminal target domain-containing protein [Calditrichaeota bacterium]|nr:MAG: T9SS C-terminal target domain-containing protein [Calditrichota bacterium]MBL1207046.1 T9SS C-terminal target domain-containing protein [Calditrichota bacterium]NOG46874.1 T9SS type A sorting domain-containing protein [Calditrichota bacterium]